MLSAWNRKYGTFCRLPLLLEARLVKKDGVILDGLAGFRVPDSEATRTIETGASPKIPAGPITGTAAHTSRD